MSALAELETLFSPIDDEERVGVDFRDDPDPNNMYRRIRDAREEARRVEKQADLDGEDAVDAMPHWRAVRDDGYQFLAEQAKDLEITAYVIEALIRTDGFAGLADGFRLARGLVESFWGDLYPTPDEDGIETTLLPIARLNGDVIDFAVSRLYVTEGVSLGPFRFWHHRQALELDQYHGEERETRVERGAVTSEMFGRAVAETAPEFFQKVFEGITAAQRELELLDSALNGRAEVDAPNLSRVKESLENCLSTLKLVAGNKLRLHEDSVGDEQDEGSTDPSSGATTQTGPIRNRDDALRLLNDVADFFERVEPQSILPAEIRKAIRRGRMSPAELYADLIRDESVLQQLFRDVGIESSVGGGDSDMY